MKQKNYYPSYFEKFRCIADKCEDSCCAMWQIVVDDESAMKYETLDGTLGQKLRSVQEIDEDGDRVFTLQEERCPFWEKTGLCEIHRLIGENYLCHTCKEYPRAVQDFGDFAEHDLSLSCPEAARIILTEDFHPLQKEVIREIPDEEICYNSSLIDMLIEARIQICELINNRTFTIEEILSICVEYAIAIEDNIFAGEYVCPELTTNSGRYDFDERTYIEELLSGEILTREWREMLLDAKKYEADTCYSLPDFDSENRRMLIHYMYRYWLRSAFDMEVTEKIERMALAYYTIKAVRTAHFVKKKELSQSVSLRIVQLYSKEVEHNCC